MWHASVSFIKKPQLARVYRLALRRALHGVGVADRQWVTKGEGGIWHCRRLLTPAEQEIAGAPLDIRGTPEHIERAALAALWLGAPVHRLLEIG